MIAFSIRQCISFVWGGCMLFRRADLVDDTYGILQVPYLVTTAAHFTAIHQEVQNALHH